MDVGVLGPLRVDDGTLHIGSRDRIVLEALVMRPGEVLSAEQLADAVWGDEPPPTWRKSLQGCVSRLRKVLGHDSVQTSPHGYRMTLPADAVDAWQFERLVARAQELLALKEPERARFTVTQGLDLWRGRPLMELEEWPPGVHEAARLAELRLGAEELRLDASLAAGHHCEVLAMAQAMVEAAPVRERRWTLLALAQYRSGRQAEALQTLHRLKRMLAEELGLDPAPDAVALEQAILRQDSSLGVEEAVPTESDQSPYLGLRPYGESDAESFFGRDSEVSQCLERLRAHGVLVVVGPSGSGKSSIVRAGVAAALRRDGRGVVVLTPGRHPMENLTRLGDRPRRQALVVDQAEELFSVCDDAVERQQFLDTLCTYSEHTWVVLALRADRTGDVATHPGLVRLVERGMFLLGGMSADSLRAAVEGPARQAGLVVEPGLVDLVVREVEGEPGALPLLSHTLRETWLRREGRTLTVAGYQASGGVRGAVSQSAERLYGRVPEEERGRLRELMLRLVAPGSTGEPVRARMPRRVVVADPVQARLVDELVAARLITSDDGVVEIAHESLVRAWPRLRSWLDEDVEGRRILHHLVATADAWDTLGRPHSELYRGVRLSTTLAWRAANHPELTAVETDFLAAGEAAAAAEKRSAADHALQQSRMIRRLSVTASAAAVLLVLALVAGFVAVQQTRSAVASATASDARRAGALALTVDDIEKSLLMAVAGLRVDDAPETRSSLLAAIGRQPALVSSMQMTGSELMRFDVSPDGRTVATYDVSNHVRLYELGSGDLLGEHQTGSETLRAWLSGDVAFSPDGSTVAVMMAAPARHPVVLLDGATLAPQRRLPGGSPGWRWQTQDLAYSADGRFLAATVRRVVGTEAATRTVSGRALVWELARPGPPTAVVGLGRGDGDGTSAAVGLSPDGSSLYTTSPLTRHDLTTGEARRIGSLGYEGVLDLSPDGRLLAVTGDGLVTVFDARTGGVRRRLPVGAGDDGFIVRFSQDGSKVATLTFNSVEVLVWDAVTGRQLAKVPVDSAGDPLDFGPDGTTIFTAGTGRALRQWDLDGSARFITETVSAAPGGATDMWTTVAPGGARVAYQSDALSFLDVASGRRTPPRARPGAHSSHGSWHPEGRHFALATEGAVSVWDAEAGTLLVERPSGPLVGADYSSDGSVLAVAEESRVRMLNPATLTPVGAAAELSDVPCALSLGPDNRTALVLTAAPERLWSFYRPPCTGWALVDLEAGTVLEKGELPVATGKSVDFSPDGGHAAVGGAGGELLVLELPSGEPVLPPATGHGGGMQVTYSADGRRIVTSGSDASVALWDGATGELISRVVAPERFVSAGFSAEPEDVVIAAWFGGPVYEWGTSIESAVEFACRAAGRDLTHDEWRDLFGTRPYEETCPED